jgi:hypothetical protein
MKIITLHNRIDPDVLRDRIQKHLNTLFREHRKTGLDFVVSGSGNVIEITQPELYQGVLFHIEVKGSELTVTRSEHYVDDVNSLTVESILNELFNDVAGKFGTDLLQEG